MCWNSLDFVIMSCSYSEAFKVLLKDSDSFMIANVRNDCQEPCGGFIGLN